MVAAADFAEAYTDPETEQTTSRPPERKKETPAELGIH